MEQNIKIGDLVKRKDIWEAWQKHNRWMIGEELREIGIVTGFSRGFNLEVTDVIVVWARHGLSYDDPDVLEVVSESR